MILVRKPNSAASQTLTNKLLGSLVGNLAAKNTPCPQHTVKLLELRLVVAQLNDFPELASPLHSPVGNVVDVLPATVGAVTATLRYNLLRSTGEKVIVERDLLSRSGRLLLAVRCG